MARLSIKVIPGSSRDEIVGWLGDALKIKVKAPLEAGKANVAVVTLLATTLNVDRRRISIASGHTHPNTVMAIEGLGDRELQSALKAVLR